MDKTVELFCGEQKGFSQIAAVLGYSTFTCDASPAFAPDLVADIRTLDLSLLPKEPLIAWAAPPHEGFLQEHWNGIDPADLAGEIALELFEATMRVFHSMKPTWWFIENPKGPLRNLPVVSGFNRGYPSRNRRTIRHDEYGGKSPQETDVWTNAYWWVPRPGQRDGTEGIETGCRVPPLVFSEILEQLDEYRTTGFYGPR